MRIVVSGNRRGLGAALSACLRAKGHEVHGFSSSAEGSDQVDTAVYAQVEAWVNSLPTPPDMVIANAAVVLAPQSLWQIEPQEFSRLIDVNVKGMFHLFRACLPLMLPRGQGILVGVSSGYGRSTTARMGPYCTSKWAVEGMVKTLAQELPKGMAAVAVDPGTLQTDMLRTALGAGAKFFPTPDQWVERAVQLLLALGPEDNGKSLSVPAPVK